MTREDPTSIADDHVRSLYVDSRGALWVGTEVGLSVKWAGAREFVNLVEDRTDPRGLRGRDLRSLMEDSGGVMWIGSHFSGFKPVESADRGVYDLPGR